MVESAMVAMMKCMVMGTASGLSSLLDVLGLVSFMDKSSGGLGVVRMCMGMKTEQPSSII